LKRVSAQRRARQDEHKATVEGTIAAVLSNSRAYDHDDALFTLVRLGEPQTVRLLAAQLDESSRLLREATRAVYLGAADPGELEAAAGEPQLVGIDAAVDRLLALELGES